jgi:hypothetical protein
LCKLAQAVELVGELFKVVWMQNGRT